MTPELAAGAFCGESPDRALGRDSSAGPGQTAALGILALPGLQDHTA